MKWARWFFYTLAFCDYAMSVYVRWQSEANRGEAGYWMSHAILLFLIGYVMLRPQPQGGRSDG